MKARIHSGCKIKVRNNGKCIFGDNVKVNYGCMFFCHDQIKIGSGVEFGPNVLVYDHDHDFRVEGGLKDEKFKTDSVSIGENSWIGANVVILRGTKIGKDCVVGAGCILKGEYPDGSVIIQKRETKVIEYNSRE